ncbi:hypothetical protein [Massilia sp.]|uniref:hypothetical protein n=1 Tax=Massilia sp. TaxID=1882437 RepID=UPI00289FA0D5|nr:hypothetical protein [Massilia sp.]
MLAQQIQTPAQTGEDQASPDVFAARSAHWLNVLLGLVGSANTLITVYMKEELADVKACVDEDHHKAITSLANQVERAKALGLTLAGAAQLAATGQANLELWSVINDQFSAGSLSDLISANDWLRPGDVVYKAETIYRHTLTEADFNAAAAPAVIGGAA